MTAVETESAIQAILASCPCAGEGVNRWLFTAALKLHRLGIEDGRIEELLEEATVDCGRGIKSGEIERAVRNSAPDKLAGYTPRRWPDRNYEQIEAIGHCGMHVAGLEAQSPAGVTEENRSEEIIDALFPGNPLLCAASNKFRPRTRPREQWRGFMARQQFIVPSPMLKVKGTTAEGKLSHRSLDNTGPRRFLVVEFDFAENDGNGNDTPAAPALRGLAAAGFSVADLCASLHAHLAHLRPIALVVHSGGKSLHGWYPCDGESEDETMRRFMRYAVSIGADPATDVCAQLVRMPDGIRDNGKRQRVLYFNPDVIGGGE
jgi:hypothetical protein